jgi:uncharacterized coiled-coil protein SlyX
MPLTIEQQLTQHTLDDERRFGHLEKHLTRIEGKIDVLALQITEARKVADSASTEVDDLAEKTGSHTIQDAKEKNEFWKKWLGTIIATVVASGISTFIASLISHR